MSQPRPAGSKRPRDRYSRLICLGCRERRIRCELPSEVEIPSPGELRTVQTPCYRCKRLGVPCVIRQTILGRPGSKSSSTTAVDFQPARTGDIVSRIIVELPSRMVARTQPTTVQDDTQLDNSSVVPRSTLSSSNDLPPSQGDLARWNGDALLIHTPQSTETIIIIRAVDTLRREKVEEEWFRHLAGHVGHTRALDLSIKAIVAACAYARGVPKLTSGDCYQALALALNAVQANIKQAHGKPNDDILASTALLAPFEGVIKKNGIPTRLHIEGLAAILAARPATGPVTQLASEILDFYACESAVMACIQGTPSPFENVARAHFVNNRMGYSDSDRTQLKALGNELFIRIPRLVSLVRSLRLQSSLQNQQLFDALRLSKSLLTLQDSQAEGRLLRNIEVHPSSDPDSTSPLRQSLHFAFIKDFEALAYYWQSRLSLLRLEWRLHDLSVSSDVQADSTDEPGVPFRPSFGPRTNEMFRLAKNILMCSEYAGTLPLRKHDRLFAHAMVVVWGVTMDVPGGLSHSQDGEGTGPLSDLLLRKVNIALAAKPDLTVEDMDTAADIFAGGQPQGRFAELYGLSLPSQIRAVVEQIEYVRFCNDASSPLSTIVEILGVLIDTLVCALVVGWNNGQDDSARVLQIAVDEVVRSLDIGFCSFFISDGDQAGKIHNGEMEACLTAHRDPKNISSKCGPDDRVTEALYSHQRSSFGNDLRVLIEVENVAFVGNQLHPPIFRSRWRWDNLRQHPH